MGRLTELHRYLKMPPQRLQDFKQQMSYLNQTEELKELRGELKLYKENPCTE